VSSALLSLQQLLGKLRVSVVPLPQCLLTRVVPTSWSYFLGRRGGAIVARCAAAVTMVAVGNSNNIRVVCRFRPQNRVEQESNGRPIVQFSDDGTAVALDVRAGDRSATIKPAPREAPM